ncbi:MAG: hypothetical protein R3A78_09955 [Polyangiales bacterium]
MTFRDIRAQALAVTTLERAVARDRVASAYLFEGPSGTGKTLTALALAEALLCTTDPGKGCGNCAVCTRIRERQHPDVRVFSPREEGAGNIPVEFVREEILPFTRYAPFEGKAAFVIFPSAEVSFPAAHPEAANAILKTLEEPKAGLHFVLASERPDRLLTTIRSRCQRLAFEKLPATDLDAILEARGIEARVREAVIPLADGSADLALQLTEGENPARFLELAFRVDDALHHAGPGTLISLADELAKDGELDLVLQTLGLVYRDIACVGLDAAETDLHFPGERANLEPRAERLSPGEAADRAARFRRVLELRDRNANLELGLDSLLLEIGGSRIHAAGARTGGARP